MIKIVNRIKGVCEVCAQPVPPFSGFAVKVDNDKWRVYDAAHVSQAQGGGAPSRKVVTTHGSGPPRIIGDITDRGSYRFRLVGGFDGALFAKALDALRGCDKHDDGSFRCRVSIGVTVVGRFADALPGVAFEPSPDMAASLQANHDFATQERAHASARAREVDERLRARGLALFPFQAEGVEWLAAKRGAILADDMGLGKTIQALTAAPEGAPIVVVCPSVAKGVWTREGRRWRPDLEPVMLAGRGSFRWPVPGQMIVTNYDVLSESSKDCPACKELRKDSDINDSDEDNADRCGKCVVLPPPAIGTVLIADEAHAIKNLKASRSRRFRSLAKAVAKLDGRTWLVTGTPLLNRPNELWSLLSTIGRAKQVFGDWMKFQRIMGIGDFAGMAVDTSKVAEPLRETMLRRMKRDVLTQLPGKTIDTLTVELTATDRRNIDRVVDELRSQGIDLEAVISTISDTKGADLDIGTISTLRQLLAVAKVPATSELLDQLEDAGEPVVVFSAHRAPVAVFGRRAGWATITGDTSPAERTKIEERFQRGELKGVAGTITAMGVAITLTRACNVIFNDPEWVPALNEQGEDRVYRIGQSKPCTATYLVADHPIDELIQRCLTRKRKIIAATVDAAAKGAA